MNIDLNPGNAASATQRHPQEELSHPYVHNFFAFVRHIGIDDQVLLEDDEIRAELDADGIRELKSASLEVRKSWAEAIALRLVRHRGIVPTCWDKVAHCHFCGPVYSYHDLHMCSCDWCDMRIAGKWFPQPEHGE